MELSIGLYTCRAAVTTPNCALCVLTTMLTGNFKLIFEKGSKGVDANS